MYFTYDDYVELYGGDRLPDESFPRISIDVDRILDRYTTGIDGFRKLREAFPEDDEDARIVKACGCHLADILYQIDQIEKSAMSLHEYQEDANGTRGKVISSKSAGNESISYSVGASGNTSIDGAAADAGRKQRLISSTVSSYLSGVKDKNGINLLYMGRYPHV